MLRIRMTTLAGLGGHLFLFSKTFSSCTYMFTDEVVCLSTRPVSKGL